MTNPFEMSDDAPMFEVQNSDLDFWSKAILLAGPRGRLSKTDVRDIGAIHEDEPQCGWWASIPSRYAQPNSPVYVRIWRDDNIIRCEADGCEASPIDWWSWVAMTPISPDRYEQCHLTIRAAFKRAM